MTFMLSAQLLAFRRHKENSCEIRRCDASIIVLNAKEKFLSEKKMFVDLLAFLPNINLPVQMGSRHNGILHSKMPISRPTAPHSHSLLAKMGPGSAQKKRRMGNDFEIHPTQTRWQIDQPSDFDGCDEI